MQPRRARTLIRSCVFLAALACLALARPCQAAPDRPEAALMLERNIAVPMRDGTILRADLWRPAGPGPFPALVCRTPYGKDQDPDELRFAARAVARGYAVVLQDVRGRYASQGDFDPHKNEGADGFDTIEWVAAQAWCDGRVGSFGLSYPGSAQWFAAAETPPHLLAMAPAMTFASLRTGVYCQGVLDMDWLRWAFVAMAPDMRAREGLPGPKSVRAAWSAWKRRGGAEVIQGHLPVLDLPEMQQAPPFLREWLAHPLHDPWWAFGDLAGRYAGVRAAVLNLSGWHDDAFSVAGAIANHQGITQARAAQPDPRSLLILGPWSHGINAVTGERRFSERDFGPEARLDYDGLVLDFMDRHVLGRKNRLEGAPSVRYFVMGENRWREAEAWPPPQARPRALHLGRERARQPSNRLHWDAPDLEEGVSAFLTDPSRPVREIPNSDQGAWDHRALDGQKDLLVFQTRPLERDVTVAGTIAAEVFVSTDAPDLDLYVKVLDVAPDGTAYNLMDSGAEVLRAGYRGASRGEAASRLLAPGQVHRLRLDTLITANTFHKGDRIRVVLCASWFPSMARNLQTGESELSSSATRAAMVRIHHGPEHQSRVILPVLPD